MFSKDELGYWLKVGMRRVATGKILEQAVDGEPELMAFCAYRKRIKHVPDDVRIAAYDRYFAMADAGGVREHIELGDIDNVCDAIWGKLSEEERRAWLLKVT